MLPLILTLGMSSGAGIREARTLVTGSLSIGRASVNDWTLPDPEKHLSKTHCVISIENGQYVLTDVSTNGVYLNGAEQPTTRGSRSTLVAGDEFRIGDYRFAVSEGALAGDPPQARATSSVSDLELGRAFSHDPLGVDPLDDLLTAPAVPTSSLASRAQQGSVVQARRGDDPFDLAEKRHAPESDPGDDLFRGTLPSESWTGPAQRDDVDAPFGSYSAPAPVAPLSLEDVDALLDDLLFDLGVAPDAAPLVFTAAPEPVPLPIDRSQSDRADPSVDALLDGAIAFTSLSAEPDGKDAVQADGPGVPQVKPTDDPGRSAPTLLGVFLKGAGLPELRGGGLSDEAIMQAAGNVFRVMVEGVRDVLMSRTAIKNEFRMEQTMLRPRGNNALKFSVTLEEALSALLLPERPGYMPPQEAAREAFADLRSHEMAVMAGMQTALLGLLRRFDPPALEAKLQPGRLGSLVPSARKARNWDLFCTTYQEIVRETEDDFKTVFGTEFARAYDAQARKI